MYRESARRRSWLLAATLGLFLALLTALTGVKTSSADHEVPLPIDPDSGELNLLELINDIPLNEVQQALDNFPVPYVVVATANGADPTVVNKNAGSPVRIDADRSKTTGKGGDDIQVEVNTELFPTPHIRVNINRITSPSDATDVQVLVAFPFQAFNDESLPSPNLFIGYQTHAAGGGAGGIAPLNEEFRILPGTLAGTDHDFILRMNTVGSVNPMTFIAGHFDGNATDGIQNALGMQAYVETVPASIEIGFDLGQSALTSPGSQSGSTVDFTWDATSQTYAEFTYFENETFPIVGDTNYGTTLSFDPMPTEETLSIVYDNSTGTGGTLSIGHTANAVVDEIVLSYHRSDGLEITATAADVPTSMAIGIDFAGSASLTVNENLGQLLVQVVQEGGFLDTEDFLGYNLGYAEFGVADAPSLTAGYDAANNSFGVAVVAPGTDIGAVWLVIGDDHDLELPPSWTDIPTHHIFSLVDDGTHGTAAARVVNLIQATLYLDASPTGETFAFQLLDDAPMQLYLETAAISVLTGKDILAQCDIDNMPYGEVDFTIDFPDQFEVSADLVPGYPETSDAASQVIDSIVCSGNIGTLNFELGVGGLPMNSGYIFDPSGLLQVKSEPTGPNTGTIGFISAHFWDETNALPSSQGLAVLLGDDLHDARMRAESIPSFVGTWSDAPGTVINFDTGIPDVTAYLGGVQVAVSTAVDLAPLAVAGPTSDHYLRFTDGGAGQPKALKVGVFGIDEFGFSTNDGAHAVSANYAANAAHRLVAEFDSAFGGEYFPNYDIDLDFTIDAVPATWNFSTDFATALNYTGSSGIASIALQGTIDHTDNNDANDATHIDASIVGLPASVSLAVDTNLDPDGGVTFTMATPITSINFLVWGSEGILGGSYDQIHLNIQHIPANWVATFNENGGSISTPGDKVQSISLIVSSDIPSTNDTMRQPFTTGGGNIDYTGFTREIDRRWAATGTGATRESDIMSRLDDIYNSTQNLGADEDRVLYRRKNDGKLMYLELKLQDLQGGSYSINDAGGSASLSIPFDDADIHPLYIGLGKPDGTFTTVQIANLPDSISVSASTGDPGGIDFVTNEPAGRVEFYDGPLPTAFEGQTANKVILVSAPAEIHVDWDFGFPGSATFDASSELEFRILSQKGGTRTVAAFRLTDLSFNYGYELFGGFDADCDLITLSCNTFFNVARVFATFTPTPGIDGMLQVYELVGAQPLIPASSVGPDGNEYVPRWSLLVEDLNKIHGEARIDICIVGVGIVPCIPGEPMLNFEFDIQGSFNLDFWDLGGGLADILGEPDYRINDPWNFVPLFYNENNRINPWD